MFVVVNKYVLARRFDGIVFWPFVFIKRRELKNNPVFMNHERIHLRQQLELLPEVDALVVHKYRVVLELPPFYEDEGPEDDPVEAPCKHIFIYHHEHAYKIRNAKFVI